MQVIPSSFRLARNDGKSVVDTPSPRGLCMTPNDKFSISTYKWFGPKSLGEGCLVALGKCHLDIASLKKKLFNWLREIKKFR